MVEAVVDHNANASDLFISTQIENSSFWQPDVLLPSHSTPSGSSVMPIITEKPSVLGEEFPQRVEQYINTYSHVFPLADKEQTKLLVLAIAQAESGSKEVIGDKGKSFGRMQVQVAAASDILKKLGTRGDRSYLKDIICQEIQN